MNLKFTEKHFVLAISQITIILSQAQFLEGKEYCAELVVTVEYREITTAKHDISETIVEENSQTRAKIERLCKSAGVDFGLGMIGAQGSYDKARDTQVGKTELRSKKEEKEVDFQDGFSQLMKDVTYLMTVDGYPAKVKETEYVDSRYLGLKDEASKKKKVKAYTVQELQELAHQEIVAMYGHANGTIRINQYYEKTCLEGNIL